MKIQYYVLLVILLLLEFSCNKKNSSDFIKISGTVEIDKIRVSPLMTGKIIELPIEEGKRVKRGSLIARIDCRELETALKQVDATLKMAKAKYELAKQGFRKEDILQSEKVLEQAKIASDKSKTDFERAKTLYESGNMPEQLFNDAKAQHEIAKSRVVSAEEQFNKLQRGFQKEEVDVSLYSIEEAESRRKNVHDKISYCKIISPIDGRILYKLAEKDEVILQGSPIAIISNTERVKVRGFVEEKQIGRIKIGEGVEIFMDSKPKIPIKAEVSYIGEEAEFTPKNIQTYNERVKSMYEVVFTAKNKNGELKSGMPVDIVIPGK